MTRIEIGHITFPSDSIEYRTRINVYPTISMAYLLDEYKENGEWMNHGVVMIHIDQIDELIALLQKAKEQASD